MGALTGWSELGAGLGAGGAARGTLPPEQLAALCDVLGGHTSTPDECTFVVRQGWPGAAAGPRRRQPRELLFAGSAHLLAVGPLSDARAAVLQRRARPVVGAVADGLLAPGPSVVRRHRARASLHARRRQRRARRGPARGRRPGDLAGARHRSAAPGRTARVTTSTSRSDPSATSNTNPRTSSRTRNADSSRMRSADCRRSASQVGERLGRPQRLGARLGLDPARNSSSTKVSMPQSVWCTSTISVVPRSRWLIASERSASAVTTPPALRITWASPSARPSTRYTSSRASMHATTATCRDGGMRQRAAGEAGRVVGCCGDELIGDGHGAPSVRG